MKDLIEAFEIFLKYSGDVKYPTCCAHDELTVCVDPLDYPNAAIERLCELGFFEDDGCFMYYKYGSA